MSPRKLGSNLKVGKNILIHKMTKRFEVYVSKLHGRIKNWRVFLFRKQTLLSIGWCVVVVVVDVVAAVDVVVAPTLKLKSTKAANFLFSNLLSLSIVTESTVLHWFKTSPPFVGSKDQAKLNQKASDFLLE